ncbi:hypothetical protein BSL78_16403 [Apostichopus japonicus]|uniref:Uncharacterized protein n=1 Tax=Stichopus japonicus TaxID=307972 RepID=A0A2G8KFK6_STIJA|nr:hypothetical protein BSL78_16403 [Apostichopus japonicus]
MLWKCSTQLSNQSHRTLHLYIGNVLHGWNHYKLLCFRNDGLQTVLVSLGICVGVVFSVSIFAIQTRFDFTGCGGFLFAFSMGLFMFGFIAIIFASTGNSVLYTVYAWLAAVLFTMFLVYDTQLIIGGRRHEISAEEYIYGALQLYVDIVYIFLIILNLVGRS